MGVRLRQPLPIPTEAPLPPGTWDLCLPYPRPGITCWVTLGK